MHWAYKTTETKELEQGDILSRSEYLGGVLKRYHPYYADHPLNTFFIVLTQSCDLVKRDAQFKTPYISIAPVRPLKAVIEREFERYFRNHKPGAQPFATLEEKSRLEEFLERIFNNNNPRYFYLEKQQDKGLAVDMCAVLSLAISIKVEHYDECLAARALQLEENFQSKLGWLVGQSFSRVATRDWTDKELETKVAAVLGGAAVWVKDEDIKHLERNVNDLETESPGELIGGKQLQELLAKIPDKKEQAINAVLSVLDQLNLVEKQGKQRFSLRKTFRSDPVFSKFFKG